MVFTYGDGGIATLIEALILEKEAATRYSKKTQILLLDLATGQTEEWISVKFDKRDEAQQDWPEGWQRPWMRKTLAEVFAAESTTDDGKDDRIEEKRLCQRL